MIHATASLPAKEWPLERFAEVMHVLKNNYNAKFVYTGAPRDITTYQKLEAIGSFGGINLCGVTNVRENISVYRLADLYFGVDSGPMHVAAAAGLPVVALLGPTDEIKWGPWGEGHTVITKRLSCSPCKPHKCGNNDCMTQISVGEALQAVEKKVQELLPKLEHH